MQNWSLPDYAILIGICTAVVTAVLTIAKEVSSRLDARAKRIDEAKKQEILDTAELKRIEVDAGIVKDKNASDLLWQIIAELRDDLAKSELKCEELDKEGKLNRPTINHIYRIFRQIRSEMDRIKYGSLDNEQTQVGVDRVKVLIDEGEGLLP